MSIEKRLAGMMRNAGKINADRKKAASQRNAMQSQVRHLMNLDFTNDPIQKRLRGDLEKSVAAGETFKYDYGAKGQSYRGCEVRYGSEDIFDRVKDKINYSQAWWLDLQNIWFRCVDPELLKRDGVLPNSESGWGALPGWYLPKMAGNYVAFIAEINGVLMPWHYTIKRCLSPQFKDAPGIEDTLLGLYKHYVNDYCNHLTRNDFFVNQKLEAERAEKEREKSAWKDMIQVQESEISSYISEQNEILNNFAMKKPGPEYDGPKGLFTNFSLSGIQHPLEQDLNASIYKGETIEYILGDQKYLGCPVHHDVMRADYFKKLYDIFKRDYKIALNGVYFRATEAPEGFRRWVYYPDHYIPKFDSNGGLDMIFRLEDMNNPWINILSPWFCVQVSKEILKSGFGNVPDMKGLERAMIDFIRFQPLRDRIVKPFVEGREK
ncbi:MAG: hypothetical protein FWD33_00730 [Alphaproteobacteria bacterium]|nr:hypothetical protein [Alphaproteobacteria bacterium]